MKNPCHKESLVALKRIEGQVRGLQKMIEDNQYCIDLLTQISAVKGALTRVEDKILEKHLHSCVTTAVHGTSRKEKDQKLKEVIELIQRTRKGYK